MYLLQFLEPWKLLFIEIKGVPNGRNDGISGIHFRIEVLKGLGWYQHNFLSAPNFYYEIIAKVVV